MYVNLVNCIDTTPSDHLIPYLSPESAWIMLIVWKPLISSSHLIPLPHAAIPSHACLQKAREFRQLFLDFTWVLWLQSFSNRLPSPTSKLNDNCCINCVTVFYAQCNVVSVRLFFSPLSSCLCRKTFLGTLCKAVYPFLDFTAVSFAAIFVRLNFTPSKKYSFDLKKSHINNRYTTPNLNMMLGSLIDVYSFYSTLRPLSSFIR